MLYIYAFANNSERAGCDKGLVLTEFLLVLIQFSFSLSCFYTKIEELSPFISLPWAWQTIYTLPKGIKRYVKCKQPSPGWEFGSEYQFLTKMTVTP